MIRSAFSFALVVLAACLGSFGLASAADAQQPASPWHIAVVLMGLAPQSSEPQALRQGLRDAGYTEGRDVVLGAVVITLAVGHEAEGVHAVPRGVPVRRISSMQARMFSKSVAQSQVFEW